MRKFACLMIVFILALTAAVALAESATCTDRSDDINFIHDTDAFEIALEDYQSDNDDNLVPVLGGRVEAWGNVFIQFIIR